jgi:hypothetical protein
LVGVKGSTLYVEILELLYPGNFEWAQNAPILVLSIVKEQFSHNNSENLHAWHDLGLAMGNLSLEATHLGIGLRQIAGFNRQKSQDWLTAKFGEHGYEAVTVTALGFPGNPDELPIALKTKEVSQRYRKDLSDLVIYSLD